jgi:hypothetical protein
LPSNFNTMSISYNEKSFENHLYNIFEMIMNKKVNNESVSFLNGSISSCFFYFNLCLHWPKKREELEILIKSEADKIIGYINENSVSPFYIDGLVGFGYTLSNLYQMNLLEGDENLNLEDLDTHIWELAKKDLETYNFDLFYGVIGIGNYFIQRSIVKPELKLKLIEIGDAIVSNKIDISEKEIIWQTKKNIENNEIDLSLSHGMSSIIAFLSKLISLNINPKLYITIVEKGCNFILSKNTNNRFPDILCENKSKYSSLRWCHGDLGVVYALAYSSKIIKNREIYIKAMEVALNIAQFRGTKEQELFSASICHGTLGVAHMFMKLSLFFENNSKIDEAATYWYNESNEIMNSTIGYNYVDNNKSMAELTGILNGIEGIGLALISSLDNKITSWDSSILLYD